MSGRSCTMQATPYNQSGRSAPYDSMMRTTPRMESGGEVEQPDVPTTPLRPPLRPCPPRPGCGCMPPTRPECGFVPQDRCGRTERASGSRRARTSRCGCNSHNDADALMAELRALEFALDEVVLYLDAYPCDQAALDFYHHLLERRAPLVEQYQAEVGPLTPLGNQSRTSWDWIDKPFPWEYDANA